MSELELLVRERDVTVEELRQQLLTSRKETESREADIKKIKDENSKTIEELKTSHQKALHQVIQPCDYVS